MQARKMITTKELRKKIHQNLMFASMMGASHAEEIDKMIGLLPDEIIDESYLKASGKLVDLYFEHIHDKHRTRKSIE